MITGYTALFAQWKMRRKKVMLQVLVMRLIDIFKDHNTLLSQENISNESSGFMSFIVTTFARLTVAIAAPNLPIQWCDISTANLSIFLEYKSQYLKECLGGVRVGS